MTTNEDAPVAVSGLSGVVAIAAGGGHSVALLSGRTVDTWGSNAYGQLGNNTTTNEDTPVAVSTSTGLPAVTQIAATENDTIALGSNETGWAWGDDHYGELGVGENTGPGTCNGIACSETPVSRSPNGVEALAPGSNAEYTMFIGGPYATLSPASGPIAFANPGVGSSSSSQVETVADTGLAPLTFGQASIVGADGDEFQITGDGCSNTTINIGSSCQIGLRYNEKVSETNPAAALRIPSNSPTSPNGITLDPPPATTGTTPKPAATCTVARVRRATLTLRCTIAHPASRRFRLRATLTRGHHRYVTASKTLGSSTFAITLALPGGLHAGNYTLTLTTGPPQAPQARATRLALTQHLKLARIAAR